MEGKGQSPGQTRGRKLRARLFPILFMVGLGAGFAAVVGAVRVALADRIAANEGLFRQRKVMEALRLIPYDKQTRRYSAGEVQEFYRQRVRDLTGEEQPVACWLGVSADGAKTDYVGVRSSWQGFWGRIDGVVTVTPEDRRIWGFAVFAHSETPGLGARMTEPEFRKQFFSGDLRVPETTGGKAQRIGIDAITGATRTSESIARFLNEQLPGLVDRCRASRPASAGTSAPASNP